MLCSTTLSGDQELEAVGVARLVYRVSKRLGLIGPAVSADKAHSQLEAALDPDMVYTFHIDMIRHGRQICQAQRPACAACPLRDLCDYYVGQRESGAGLP